MANAVIYCRVSTDDQEKDGEDGDVGPMEVHAGCSPFAECVCGRAILRTALIIVSRDCASIPFGGQGPKIFYRQN